MDCSNLFAPVIGQIQAITLLQNAITKNRIAPAYLFAGPTGVGRALTARLFAGTLLAQGLSPEQSDLAIRRAAAGNHPDLWWVEPTFLHQGKRLTLTEAITAGLKRKAPPQIRIEQIREIGQFLSKPPLEARQAMVIIESAETMPEAAANALLKTLEEPGRATIILIAPAAESLLPTLVSRCQKIPFHRLNSGDLETVLRRLGQADILEHAVLMATGSPGEAIGAYEKQQTIPSD
ncbi:MAG: DNA polymerase III subunit delta', partial [Cyanobacteria bacterium P01_H01_bin.15]